MPDTNGISPDEWEKLKVAKKFKNTKSKLKKLKRKRDETEDRERLEKLNHTIKKFEERKEKLASRLKGYFEDD